MYGVFKKREEIAITGCGLTIHRNYETVQLKSHAEQVCSKHVQEHNTFILSFGGEGIASHVATYVITRTQLNHTQI